MNVMLYEGDDATGLLGMYKSPSELKVGQIVAIPSGATYKINKLFKGTTTDGGQSYEQENVFCTRSSSAGEQIIQLTIQPQAKQSTLCLSD
jgi:hypothetical protein